MSESIQILLYKLAKNNEPLKTVGACEQDGYMLFHWPTLWVKHAAAITLQLGYPKDTSWQEAKQLCDNTMPGRALYCDGTTFLRLAASLQVLPNELSVCKTPKHSLAAVSGGIPIDEPTISRYPAIVQYFLYALRDAEERGDQYTPVQLGVFCKPDAKVFFVDLGYRCKFTATHYRALTRQNKDFALPAILMERLLANRELSPCFVEPGTPEYLSHINTVPLELMRESLLMVDLTKFQSFIRTLDRRATALKKITRKPKIYTASFQPGLEVDSLDRTLFYEITALKRNGIFAYSVPSDVYSRALLEGETLEAFVKRMRTATYDYSGIFIRDNTLYMYHRTAMSLSSHIQGPMFIAYKRCIDDLQARGMPGLIPPPSKREVSYYRWAPWEDAVIREYWQYDKEYAHTYGVEWDQAQWDFLLNTRLKGRRKKEAVYARISVLNKQLKRRLKSEFKDPKRVQLEYTKQRLCRINRNI